MLTNEERTAGLAEARECAIGYARLALLHHESTFDSEREYSAREMANMWAHVAQALKVSPVADNPVPTPVNGIPVTPR